jgi:hypothetical protein
MMSRVKRDITVMEGVAADLKRFIGMHLREISSSSAALHLSARS